MFYIEKEGKILLFDSDRKKLEATLSFMPELKDLDILETNRPIVDFQFADTEEFQQEQAQKERERLNMLSLTAADVERAIYKVKGMDFEDVVEMVSKLVETPPPNPLPQGAGGNPDTPSQPSPLGEGESPQIDVKALKIELKANNFYRGNPYIEQVGALLGFTPEMLDEFFETGDYTKLIAPPVADNTGEEIKQTNNSGEEPIEGDTALVEPEEL